MGDCAGDFRNGEFGALMVQLIPPPRNRTGVTAALRELEVGGEPVTFYLEAKQVMNVIQNLKKRGFGRYVTRRTKEGSVKVWRVA